MEEQIPAKRVRYSNSTDSNCSISSAITEIIEACKPKISLPNGPITRYNTTKPVCVVSPYKQRERSVSPSILEGYQPLTP